ASTTLWRGTRPSADGYAARARLDEPPRQQQVLTEGVSAVAVADFRGLAFQLEDLAPAGAGGQVECPLLQVPPFLLGAIAVADPAGRIQPGQQLPTALHAGGIC